MKRWLHPILWLGLTLALSACLPSTVPPSQPPAPSPTHPRAATPARPPTQIPSTANTPRPSSSAELRIAFHSDRDGNLEIYIMNADGSNPVNLTNHPAADSSPAWSPDGARIAFHSNRDGEPDLYIMNTDGTEVTRLTNSPASNVTPAWSPDGTRLAFTSTEHGRQIHVINADGTGEIQVTDLPGFNGTPAWSPADNTSIAFYHEDQHYSSAIKAIQPDGSGTVRLTSGGTYHDIHPSWSPNGEQLAFASERLAHLKFEIFVTPVRQSNDDEWPEAKQLTNTGGTARSPAWSPILPGGGSRIAFSAVLDGEKQDIYVMSPDGSDLVRLTDHPAVDAAPSWSPLP